MNSELMDIAEKLADRINGGSYPHFDTFTAQAVGLVELDRPDINDAVIVEVMPRGLEIGRLARGSDRNEKTVGVAIIKHIAASGGKVSASEIDGLIELAESIIAHIRDTNLTLDSGTVARWIRTETEVLYDPAALYSQQQFRGVLNVTYLTTT